MTVPELLFRPIAEYDYFPCAWCKERFDTPALRRRHEQTCKVADDEEAAMIAARHNRTLRSVLQPEPRELPSPFVAEFGHGLTQGRLVTMLRCAGLELVDRGENKPYLLRTTPNGSRRERIECMRAEIVRLERAIEDDESEYAMDERAGDEK